MRYLLTIICLFFTTNALASDQGYCFEEAGQLYQVSPGLLWAIAKTESDFNPTATNWNKNGSLDYGVMQINDYWKDKIGEQSWNALGDPCHNIKVGAYVLADCLSRYGYTYEGIGCYNAISYDKRIRYAEKVIKNLEALNQIIADRQQLEETDNSYALVQP